MEEQLVIDLFLKRSPLEESPEPESPISEHDV